MKTWEDVYIAVVGGLCADSRPHEAEMVAANATQFADAAWSVILSRRGSVDEKTVDIEEDVAYFKSLDG